MNAGSELREQKGLVLSSFHLTHIYRLPHTPSCLDEKLTHNLQLLLYVSATQY